VIHEREALGYERNNQELEGEFRRKARVMAGGFQCLLRGEALPGLGQFSLLFRFVSHKVLRWSSGILTVALLGVLICGQATGLASDPLLAIALPVLTGALGGALLAQVVPGLRRIKLVNLLHYIFMLKLASLAGLYLGLSGKQKVTWRGSTT
jgi:hypothetical protein